MHSDEYLKQLVKERRERALSVADEARADVQVLQAAIAQLRLQLGRAIISLGELVSGSPASLIARGQQSSNDVAG